MSFGTPGLPGSPPGTTSLPPSTTTFNNLPGSNSGYQQFFANASIQKFRNTPVINRISNLFSLQIVGTNAPGHAKSSVYMSYFFPISPTGLIKTIPVLNRPFTVQGIPVAGGAQYYMDIYGQAPPVWKITGTTGWQYHLTDGNTLTGTESLRFLQTFFRFFHYLSLNQTSSTTTYIIELYNYAENEFWEVIPVDKLIFSYDEKEPLFGKYDVTLQSIRKVADPPSPLVLHNPLAQALGNIAQGAVSTAANLASSVLNLGETYTF